MKFYQRHPIIFITEIIFIILYFALPVIILVATEVNNINNVGYQQAAGAYALMAGVFFWMGGWMFFPLIVLAPFIGVILINTIISFFDPIEQVVSNDDYSKWVKSGGKI